MDGQPLAADQVTSGQQVAQPPGAAQHSVGQILSPGAKLSSQLLGAGSKLASQIKKKRRRRRDASRRLSKSTSVCGMSSIPQSEISNPKSKHPRRPSTRKVDTAMSTATMEFADTTKKLGDQIVGLTLKEAKELSDYLKDVHGIEPAAGGAVMMAGPVLVATVRGCRRREDRVRRRAGRLWR